MSLGSEKRAERDAAKVAILAYWREVRGRYERDQQAARIVGNHCGCDAAHVLYVVKLAKKRGEDVL